MCLETLQNLPKEPWVFNEIGTVQSVMRYKQDVL